MVGCVQSFYPRHDLSHMIGSPMLICRRGRCTAVGNVLISEGIALPIWMTFEQLGDLKKIAWLLNAGLLVGSRSGTLSDVTSL